MALPTIIHSAISQGADDTAALLATFTCPTDGYVYIWPDATDPMRYWYLGACPVHNVAPGATVSVYEGLKVQITASVEAWYARTDTGLDAHRRVLQILSGVAGDAVGWLNEHTSEDIAHFLAETQRLHALILEELYIQGVVA